MNIKQYYKKIVALKKGDVFKFGYLTLIKDSEKGDIKGLSFRNSESELITAIMYLDGVGKDEKITVEFYLPGYTGNIYYCNMANMNCADFIDELCEKIDREVNEIIDEYAKLGLGYNT